MHTPYVSVSLTVFKVILSELDTWIACILEDTLALATLLSKSETALRKLLFCVVKDTSRSIMMTSQKRKYITVRRKLVCTLKTVTLAAFIPEDALSVWKNQGKHSLYVSSVETGTRCIIRLDELCFVVRRSRSTTEDSS